METQRRLEVTVLLAAEEDLDAIALLEAAAFQPRGGIEVARGRLDEERARPWSRLWVAKSRTKREVLGFLLAWHVADELHILNVATRKADRQKGVGKALVRAALTYATRAGIALITLEVRRSNAAAQRLYGAFGFVVAAERKRYYDDGEDGWEMQLVMSKSDGRFAPRAS